MKPSLVAAINSFNTWTPSQFIEAFGGSTRRAAEALGVSQRTVQRYITTGKQHYNPAKGVQQRMNVEGRKVQGDKPVGITYAGTFTIRGSDEDTRGREINRVYDSDTWDKLSERAAAGDESGAWRVVADEYLHGGTMSMLDGEILIGEE